MDDRAPDRPLVPDLRVADQARREGDDGAAGLEHRAAVHVVVPRARPDTDLVGVLLDIGERSDPADVDQGRGPGETQFHHRDQRMAAGEQLCLRPVALEQREGMVHRVGDLVVEFRGNHA